MANTFYNSNPNLKSIGQIIPYTQEDVAEYLRCKNDPIYFIKNYIKIVSLDKGMIPFSLYDYQVEFINSLHENRKTIGMFPRQHGKTTTVAAYLVWYCNFNESKTVAILANKAAAAREVMDRFQMMYESIPMWMQQGVSEWNKGSIKLENKSKAFTAATTASGIRGKSCVTGDTRVCVVVDDNFFYTEIYNIINNSRFINIKDSAMIYTVYKTTNKVNNKIYVGFHKTTEDSIITESSIIGSIYRDGYLGSGKILKKAIEKYGPESFKQELLGKFVTKESAEEYEKSIVNRDFTMRHDTYNISIGGNVRIMYGNNNGFFRKTHTSETKEIISNLHTGNKYFSNSGNYKIRNIKTGVVYLDYEDFNKNENITKYNLVNLVGQGLFEFLNEERQKQALDLYSTRLTQEEKSNILSKLASERFTDVPKTDIHKERIGVGIRKFISEHPDEHKQKMDKINKNPEKIKKTAEKHIGMKRSQETCQNISNALKGNIPSNKGTKMAYDPNTFIIEYFKSIEDIPSNYIIGRPKTKNENSV